MPHSIIRPRTVSIIGKLLRPLADEGLTPVPELREILANLKYLANRLSSIH
jgi:hypothetical protein